MLLLLLLLFISLPPEVLLPFIVELSIDPPLPLLLVSVAFPVLLLKVPLLRPPQAVQTRFYPVTDTTPSRASTSSFDLLRIFIICLYHQVFVRYDCCCIIDQLLLIILLKLM